MSFSSRPSSSRIPAAINGAPIACTTSTPTAMRGASGWVASRSNPRCSARQRGIDRSGQLHLVRRTGCQQPPGLQPPWTSGPTSRSCSDACARRRRDNPPATPSTAMSTTFDRISRWSIGRRLVTYSGAEHDQHEHDVHDRRGGLVEVVVVRGDELADLVDEQPEPDPTDQRRGRPHHGPDVREQQVDRQQHQQAAGQHVRDVQALAADLRVAAQPEDQPGDQHRRDARHHEGGQVLADAHVAHQAGPQQVRRPRARGVHDAQR